jgi:hypothetical protein
VVVVVASLIVLFFFYPSLVQVALSLFACYPLDRAAGGAPDHHQGDQGIANASSGYWVMDMQQPCWEGWHKTWAMGLAVPCVLLWCLFTPLGIALLLITNKHRLANPGFRTHVGFLYHLYRKERYYWEAFSTLQVLTGVAISVFSFTLGAYFSAILLNASFVFAWALSHVFKPYAFRELQHTNLASTATLYFTTLLALTLFTMKGTAAPAMYGNVMGGIGLAANLMFVIWCGYQMTVATGSKLTAGCLVGWWRKLSMNLAFRQWRNSSGASGNSGSGSVRCCW